MGQAEDSAGGDVLRRDFGLVASRIVHSDGSAEVRAGSAEVRAGSAEVRSILSVSQRCTNLSGNGRGGLTTHLGPPVPL